MSDVLYVGIDLSVGSPELKFIDDDESYRMIHFWNIVPCLFRDYKNCGIKWTHALYMVHVPTDVENCLKSYVVCHSQSNLLFFRSDIDIDVLDYMASLWGMAQQISERWNGYYGETDLFRFNDRFQYELNSRYPCLDSAISQYYDEQYREYYKARTNNCFCLNKYAKNLSQFMMDLIQSKVTVTEFRFS